MRPQSLEYAVDERPPAARLALLGVQYAVMIAIYLVLVVIVLQHTNASADTRVKVLSLALVAAGAGTALQAMSRGPVGAGFLAPPVYSATYLGPAVLAAEAGGLPLVAGMTIFAGLVEIAVAFTLTRLRVVFQPILGGLCVFVVGLQLGIVGIGETLDVAHERLAAYHLHLIVTVTTLGICVALSIWGRGTWRLLCTLVGLGVGVILAAALGLITAHDLEPVRHAAWLTLPSPGVLSFSFDPGLVPAFLAAGIAAALRAVGVVTTCQRINDADWKRPDMQNIRKGLLADGLGCILGGMAGAPGMNIAPSLVGVSSATGATSRAIGFAAAAVLFCLAFTPKLAAAFLALPLEVAGAVLVFTASFMITGGMQIMLSRPLDTRAVYVVGVSTLLALSKSVFPAYFQDLPHSTRLLASSPLAIGITAAIVLTLIFHLGTKRRAGITWTSAADSVAEALDFLRHRMQEWKVDADTAGRSAGAAEQVLSYVAALGRGREEGRLLAIYDGIDLVLDISYHGHPIPAARLESQSQKVAAIRLEDEEAPVTIGLQSFLRGISADRRRIHANRQRVSVRLWYAA